MPIDVSSPSDTGDSRETLMQIPDLRRYFYNTMAREISNVYDQSVATPSPFGLLVSVILAIVLLIIKQTAFFGMMIALLGAQVVWIIWARKHVPEAGNLGKLAEEIQSGKLPPKLSEAALKRLRWWDHLIVPQDWTPNSRVFDIRKRLEIRLSEIDEELAHWASPAGKQELEAIEKEQREAAMRRSEQRERLRSLQSRGAQGVVVSDENEDAEVISCDDPAALTTQVLTSNQCEDEIKRILCFQNPQKLAQQEKVLHLAMMMKIDKISELLDRVIELRPALEKIKPDKLSESVEKALGVLEERRAVVIDLNRVNHASAVRLLSYNIQFVKTAIALRAHGVGT